MTLSDSPESATRPEGRNPFAFPSGIRGEFAGWLLARFNAELNRKAIEWLAITSTDRVLEIGFGPGVGLELIATRADHGHVAGIDPSEVMMRQAGHRNRSVIASGRLELREGTAERLPWPSGSFDAVLSLNNILLWNPLASGLAEVGRVLRPEGRLLVGLHAWAARGESRRGHGSLGEVSRDLSSALVGAGFVNVRFEVVSVPIGHALLLLAFRPGA